jgi:hypothetical protein
MMARMPDIFHEAEEAVLSHLIHPHHASATAVAAAVNIRTSTPGGPVSLSADLHAIAARVEHYDDETLAALDAVKGNAATADAFAVLRDLTGFNVSPDIITLVTTGLTALRDRLASAAAGTAAPAADPSFTPAGPTVAGQA